MMITLLLTMTRENFSDQSFDFLFAPLLVDTYEYLIHPLVGSLFGYIDLLN